ncbi:predicted protein [Histoplasma mississippiense (nom. inval.)]|uniref:predicted protein n=1 Tax=Ajellomyces capsulatus (strain NAm1 / WU24) TaxID=2059318 RepID=UPI000157B360|nr:predicted protein [Histoplasma mississippiense (nom. inval.)]EDN02710.1 predicted protein [Histoplasma mississippiense (nom. inval.)]
MPSPASLDSAILENNLAREKHAKDDLMRRVKLAEQASGIPEMVSACENCSATRCQPDIIIKPEPEELETDFTALFSTNRDRTIRTSETSVSPSRVIDPCGFCQDGTPCVCAEMAAEEENNSTPIKLHNRLTIRNLSQFTPPPSEGDVLSEPLHSNPKKANPCINGPGTCAQCKADPKSTLFCKSLAASRSTSAAATATSSGCCGGGNSRGGCCQSQEMNTPSSSTSSTQRQPISLSCADTYTALSRHPNFSRATDDLNTWLPRLHTLPTLRDPPLTDYGNRPAMEVEAASVMGVLKYFDRRFAD